MASSSSNSPVNVSQQDQDHSSKSEDFKNLTMDSKVRTGMEEMRQAGILCDVTLVAGNVEIPAHKVVLANTSHYFYSMFIGGLKEESPVIPIKGLEPETLSSLVEYSYTSKLSINQDNVINMLVGAKMLLFSEVTEACSRFLKNQLQLDICLELNNFA